MGPFAACGIRNALPPARHPEPSHALCGTRSRRGAGKTAPPSRQFGFRYFACEPPAQRLERLPVVPPFPDRGSVDRTADLNCAGGCRGRRAGVKTQNFRLPRKADEFDETAALCRLVVDDVFVAHFQQRVRRQRRSPVPGQTTKRQIVFRQFIELV